MKRSDKIAYQRDWYVENRIRLLKRNSLYYLENRERLKDKARETYCKNRKKRIVHSVMVAKKNRSRYNAYTRAWKKRNPEQIVADAAIRKAMQLKACPPWVNRNQLKCVYEKAQLRTRATGISYHVDHRYPLFHPLFTGLHVPWNLRVIVGTQNILKSNKIKHKMLAMSFT